MTDSIKLYNSLNNKIIPQLDHEVTSDNEEITKNNVKHSKNFRSYYNDHIGFETDYESDISCIQTNKSFSSLSEIEL